MNERVCGCALFTPYMNSTFLSESNANSSENVQPSTFSCISLSVLLFCSLCHIFCVSIIYVWVLFISEHVATLQLCLHISHKQLHVLLRDTLDKSDDACYGVHYSEWVNGTLNCKNLSSIKVWTARERSVRGMCQWKEMVVCREKILTNNSEWLCDVFRLCVYRYLMMSFVTRLSH